MPLKTRNRPQVHIPRQKIIEVIVKAEPEELPPVFFMEKPVNKLPTYTELVEFRTCDVEGTQGYPDFLEDEDKWLWIKEDNGAWDGPQRDWRSNHRLKYFKYLKKRDVVITAGANQGMYVRFLAKKFGQVYAFEPDPLNFHCMSVNNQRDNVIKMNCALGSKAGWCMVQRNGFNNTGTWSVNEENKGHIPVMTIDSLNFETVDLIQLDTEGYEEKALLGALETLRRCRPVVILENGQTPGLQTLLNGMDYKEVDQSVADKVFVPK